MSTFADLFGSETEAQEFLTECTEQAGAGKEATFVAQMNSKFRAFGLSTFCSDAQYQWLERIEQRKHK